MSSRPPIEVNESWEEASPPREVGAQPGQLASGADVAETALAGTLLLASAYAMTMLFRFAWWHPTPQGGPMNWQQFSWFVFQFGLIPGWFLVAGVATFLSFGSRGQLSPVLVSAAAAPAALGVHELCLHRLDVSHYGDSFIAWLVLAALLVIGLPVAFIALISAAEMTTGDAIWPRRGVSTAGLVLMQIGAAAGFLTPWRLVENLGRIVHSPIRLW